MALAALVAWLIPVAFVSASVTAFVMFQNESSILSITKEAGCPILVATDLIKAFAQAISKLVAFTLSP